MYPQKFTNTKELTERAQLKSLAEMLKEAILDYDTLISIQYTSNNFLKRGFIYTKLKAYEKGVENYSKAIELDPGNFFAYSAKAYALRYMGKKTLAQETLRTLRKSEALKGINLLNCSTIKSEFEMYDEALEDAKAYLKANPNYHRAYIQIGNIYNRQRNFKDALKSYNHAIERGVGITGFQSRGGLYLYSVCMRTLKRMKSRLLSYLKRSNYDFRQRISLSSVICLFTV